MILNCLFVDPRYIPTSPPEPTLIMTVDGVVQNHACVGQSIMLNCDIEAASHVWRTSVTSRQTEIIPNAPFNPDDPPFLYFFASIKSERNFVTSATVSATADLNGTVVSCGGSDNSTSFLNATILVFGEFRVSIILCLMIM